MNDPPSAPLEPLEGLRARGFEIEYVSHAAAILEHDFPEARSELDGVLGGMALPIAEIVGSGGGETLFTQRLRRALAELGWHKHEFVIQKVVDGTPRESTSHEVDHVRRYERGVVACEIEWNNKDPFFDRDLENFKRLHAEGAISVGILITRGESLQAALNEFVMRFAQLKGIKDLDTLTAAGVQPTPKHLASIMRRATRQRDPVAFDRAWVDQFVSSKYGAATTHWAKLKHRIERGVGNPCPLLLIGLPASIVTFDADAVVEQLAEDGAS